MKYLKQVLNRSLVVFVVFFGNVGLTILFLLSLIIHPFLWILSGINLLDYFYDIDCSFSRHVDTLHKRQ